MNRVKYGKQKKAMRSGDGTPVMGEFEKDVTLGKKKYIDAEDVIEATAILQKYMQGKAALDSRIIEDEEWWKLRHWEAIRGKSKDASPKPSSAWLFNAILNKHADAMDNYPEAVVLPRERSDEDSAKMLSSVLPVIFEENGFEDTYASAWWSKLKHGTSVYQVSWDNEKQNGLGDISVTELDLLRVYFEPGVTDIQKSRHLFILELQDVNVMDEIYPQYAGSFGGDVSMVKQYLHDDTIDTTGKCVVVNWYYKAKNRDGKTTVQYVKYSGNCVLYASMNEPDIRERGFYDHGLYPVVFDNLFPEKDTPIGFGYVAICKDPQLYIDALSANILETSLINSKKRYFVSRSASINKDQFLDTNEPLVEVEGDISDARVREIGGNSLDSIYVTVMNNKIEEMKDTAANRDVNSGGSGGGVTAASAIAALQEAGNKASRDMISASYRAYTKVLYMCIELIRQFYDEPRSFRITEPNTFDYQFAEVSNKDIKEQETGVGDNGQMMYRVPVFDLKLRAQKKNPFSRMEQNELAKELYAAGFFNPDRAQEAMGALQLMDFEGIDKVRERVSEGNTLENLCKGLAEQLEQIKVALNMQQTGVRQKSAPAAAPKAMPTAQPNAGGGEDILGAPVPMTGYGEKLAQAATPEV